MATAKYLLVLLALTAHHGDHSNALWIGSQLGRQELVLSLRVGKRSSIPHVIRRRDFIDLLSTSLQRNLRGAIHEIPDMTESKRSQLEPLVLLDELGEQMGRGTR